MKCLAMGVGGRGKGGAVTEYVVAAECSVVEGDVIRT